MGCSDHYCYYLINNEQANDEISPFLVPIKTLMIMIVIEHVIFFPKGDKDPWGGHCNTRKAHIKTLNVLSESPNGGSILYQDCTARPTDRHAIFPNASLKDETDPGCLHPSLKTSGTPSSGS